MTAQHRSASMILAVVVISVGCPNSRALGKVDPWVGEWRCYDQTRLEIKEDGTVNYRAHTGIRWPVEIMNASTTNR